MDVVTTNAESKLLDRLGALKQAPAGFYGLHFHLSRLQEQYRSEFQLKIAINILNDVFRKVECSVYSCRNSDICLIYQGADKALLEQAIFQLRYLFVDDPLASHADGSDNESFCSVYDLGFQWHALFSAISSLAGQVRSEGRAEPIKTEPKRAPLLEKPRYSLVQDIFKAETILENMDLGLALRRQPVCAKALEQDIKVLYHEIYINISQLTQLLGGQLQITADKTLFAYLTRQLDYFVLQLLAMRSEIYLKRPVSLNLNVQTLLSPVFDQFHEKVGHLAPSIVVEIQIADVFMDIGAFVAARNKIQSLGYRLCVDGLNNLSFIQVHRESLGFDLAKLQWNADFKSDLNNLENKRLAKAVKECGAKRIILCRCDSVYAVEYGHALSISLFQGRYVDRIISPDARIVN